MPINRRDVEVRSQAHLMDAEGMQPTQPQESEIIEILKNEGWIATNIDIDFDDVMQLWTWTADISEGKK